MFVERNNRVEGNQIVDLVLFHDHLRLLLDLFLLRLFLLLLFLPLLVLRLLQLVAVHMIH